MILAILRNVSSNPSHLRTPQIFAWFSSSSRIQNKVDDVQGMRNLIHSERRQEQQDIVKTLDAATFITKDRWNAFQELRFIKPRDLTYKSRLKTPPLYRKRPLVGPPRHVARHTDMFHKLGLDPVRECTNHVLLSHFVTQMGRIKGRKDTGLTTKSQRRLGKAIRRAKMMGVIPILSNASIHPSSRFTLQPGKRYQMRETA